MSTSYRALAGRIQQELEDLELAVDRCEQLLRKVRDTGDNDYFDGIALNLHSFYTGVESLLEGIARTMEGSIPSGANWHQELLQQMSATIDSVRPPVIRTETRRCLDEYRGFRHVVRNVYTFYLRRSRLEELAGEVGACYEKMSQDILAFRDFLNQLEV